MAKIGILIGTVYGTAQFVADEIVAQINGSEHQVYILEHATGDALGNGTDQDTMDILLVCTATTGAGDLPDDILPFYNDLKATPRALGHLHFAVIALGDSSYIDTFCGAGKTMHETLLDLGALPLADPLEIDAAITMTPEEDALPWLQNLLGQYPG